MKTLHLIVTLILAFASAAISQQAPCPCGPLSYQWIVEPCESWNCAAASMIIANGDKYVLAVPTNSDDFKRVIIHY